MVPIKEIQENHYDLSINRYKKVVHEQKLYDKPEIIIEQIEELDRDRKFYCGSWKICCRRNLQLKKQLKFEVAKG